MSKHIYNGIELPDLPEWDMQKYPYFCIVVGETLIFEDVDDFEPTHAQLYASSLPIFIAIGASRTVLCAKQPVESMTCSSLTADSSKVGWDKWDNFTVENQDTIGDHAGIGHQYYRIATIFSYDGTMGNDFRVQWTNHDIYNLATGELYLATNTDPVPVDPPAVAPEVEPKSFMAGWRMGQFIRGMRG